jgi:PTS system mannose-specific IIC component
MITPYLWRAAIWAGIIALDITGFGPTMMAQPLVAGPWFGWLLGQVQVGVVIGGIVQLLWMDVSPIGVGIPFDTTAVTLLSVYWACQHPVCGVPQMMLALSLAVPFGHLFCRMDSYARRLNTLLARRLESAPDAYLAAALGGGILAGLGWSWLRYAVAYGVAMLAGDAFWRWAERFPIPLWATQGLQVAAYLFPIAGLGVALELFLTEEPERRLQALRPFKPRG